MTTTIFLDLSLANLNAIIIRCMPIIALAIAYVVIEFVAMWWLFAKAGVHGWCIFIPFVNLYKLYRITFGSGWWFLMTLIPIVGTIFNIVMLVKLSYSFGHKVGYALGLIFLGPIFFCILGFGSSQYIGPGGKPRYR